MAVGGGVQSAQDFGRLASDGTLTAYTTLAETAQPTAVPNLFAITGPGSPSVLSNMIVSIEQHVDWIADCVDRMRAEGRETIEATVAAQDAWVAHVNEIGHATLYPRANSWYMGANIAGKPRAFLPYLGPEGVGGYRKKCAEVAAKNYEGFALS